MVAILTEPKFFCLINVNVSTGEVNTELINYDIDKLINEVIRLDIKELIVNDSIDRKIVNTLRENYSILITISDTLLDDELYKYIYDGITDIRVVNSVKHLLSYLSETKKGNLTHLQKVNIVDKNKYLELDVHSKRNLELVETLRLKERTYSLLWLLDKTKTSMGARKLQSWILSPLNNVEKINYRLCGVEKLFSNI